MLDDLAAPELAGLRKTGYSATTPQSPQLCNALAGANVVIYDRSLAALVGEILPLGVYAEPWSPEDADERSLLAPRAVKFAAEGWRVVQLVNAQPLRRRRLHDIAAANEGSAVSIRSIELHSGGGALLLVFGAPSYHQSAAAPAFTANGLAG